MLLSADTPRGARRQIVACQRFFCRAPPTIRARWRGVMQRRANAVTPSCLASSAPRYALCDAMFTLLSAATKAPAAMKCHDEKYALLDLRARAAASLMPLPPATPADFEAAAVADVR